MFHLASVPILLDVAVVFLGSVVVLTANGGFRIRPLLHSANDVVLMYNLEFNLRRELVGWKCGRIKTGPADLCW